MFIYESPTELRSCGGQNDVDYLISKYYQMQKSNYSPSPYYIQKQKEFTASLMAYGKFELVNTFNKETSHNGWVSVRASFLSALSTSLIDKGIDISDVITRQGGLILKYPVFLNREDKLVQIKPLSER